jgi:hypothetical protein
MARRGAKALVVTAVLAVILFGLQTPSFAAQRTVVLDVPGCV